MRSACPIVGVPAGTGDVTLFNPPGSTDSRAIDVTATITDVRATCQDVGQGRRIDRNVHGGGDCGAMRARRGRSCCPISTSLFRAAARSSPSGSARSALNFPRRQPHAWTRVQATVRVNRGGRDAARERPPDPDPPAQGRRPEAAVDPLADPAVRAAVANATFEHLVGFQMTQDSCSYNATR